MNSRSIIKTILCFIFLFCLAHQAFSDDYIIGPDDTLDVSVWKDDNLTKSYTVDQEGNISMPYINEVKVSGLSTTEAVKFIAGKLKSENFLVDPVVTVSVKEYRSQKIMVFGTVKKPGSYYLTNKTMVLDFLPKVEPNVEAGKMVILRKDSAGKELSIDVDLYALIYNGDLKQNIEVKGGDKIIVSPRANKDQQTCVPGEVKTPGLYVIVPDDTLDVSVWKDDNLTKSYTVDQEGNISMPYINDVKVSGLSTAEAARSIARRLKAENLMVDPVVTVSVKEYGSQKIMVFGTVKKPGSYYLAEKTMVLDFLPRIDLKEEEAGKMVILRKNSAGKELPINVDLHALIHNGDLAQNIEIKGGDKVIISPRINKSQQIYVLGEVKTPGPYTMERDMTVLEALRLAGGFTDFANRGKIKIIREENGEKTNIIVKLNKIGEGDKSQDIVLKAGDVLVALKSWF